MYTLGGLLILSTGGLLWLAYDSYGMLDVRKAVLFVLSSVVVFAAGVGVLVLVNRNPDLNNARIGARWPGWDCQNLGRGAAVVCTRDK